MKKYLLLITCLYFLICSSSVIHTSGKHFVINRLKTEYAEIPLGIDVEKPRFSWQMYSDVNGAYQTAYQIIVTDESGDKVWDSEKTESDISLNISYAGTTLKPMTRYYWQVIVWDGKKKQQTARSGFETGLMNPGLSAWNRAAWIREADKDMVLYSHYLPVFKIDYILQLDEHVQTTKAGFVYGANDQRLMDKNMNIYGLESRPNESYFMLELDITPLVRNKESVSRRISS